MHGITKSSRYEQDIRLGARQSEKRLSSHSFATANAAQGVRAASSSGVTGPAKWTLWRMLADAWICLKRSGRNCQMLGTP